MEIDKLFENNSIDNVADNVFGVVNNSVSEVREMQRKKVAENVQLVVNALKKIEEDIREKYDSVSGNLEKRIISIKDGRDGINGRDGKDGKDGKPGKEGRPGRDGKDGKNGLNGADGQDGVSVVNAHIDFDGSLIISLSSGIEINVGEVVAPALAEQIKVITNGGGTAQSVLDTLTSLQSQIDAIGDAVVYKGLWNASTNSPTITSGVGTSGNFYIVSVAGSTNLDGITNWKEGDWAVFNGVAWQRVEGGADGNFTTVTASSLTSGRVTYAGAGGLLQDSSNLTFNGTTLTSAGFSGPLNGTVGATTPSTGAFTTLSSTGNTTLGDASTDTVTVNGYMGVGGGGVVGNGLQVVSSALSGVNQTGVYSALVGTSGGTNRVRAFLSFPASAAASYTVNDMSGFWAADVSKGAGSTITNLHGLYIADQTQGTNNYGITSVVSSGANKWNIYASGTAANYFAGNVGIGTSSPTLPLTVDGEISTLFDNNGTALEATAVFIGNGNSASTATHARVAIIGSTTGTVGELYFTNRGVGSYNSFGCGIRGGYAGADARNNTLTFFTSHTTDENVERVRIESTGNVGIGTSSPTTKTQITKAALTGFVSRTAATLTLENSGDTELYFASGNANVGQLRFGDDGGNFRGAISYDHSSDGFLFYTAGTERMRIDSSGNVGIGTSSPSSKLQVANGALTISDATTHAFLKISPNSGSAAFFDIPTVGSSLLIRTSASSTTDTNSLTITSSGNVNIGSSAYTRRLSVKDTTNTVVVIEGSNSGSSNINFADSDSENPGSINYSHATNYMAFQTAGAERARIDSSGAVLAGTTSASISSSGLKYEGANGALLMVRDGNTPFAINRLTNDGNLIEFYQATSLEGTISVSGTTVSYNGGHLARWSQTTDNTRIPLVKGTVMSNLDQMANWDGQANEQLNCMKVSDVEGDVNVAGVFVNWDNDDAEFTNDMNIAMTGDMIIRIAQGTVVQRGDLLMSAGDGTAKPQGDDIVRSKTVAKVTSTHITCTYDDGSYCVPCVLMAC